MVNPATRGGLLQLTIIILQTCMSPKQYCIVHRARFTSNTKASSWVFGMREPMIPWELHAYHFDRDHDPGTSASESTRLVVGAYHQHSVTLRMLY